LARWDGRVDRFTKGELVLALDSSHLLHCRFFHADEVADGFGGSINMRRKFVVVAAGVFVDSADALALSASF
jgi:hypothetical protein